MADDSAIKRLIRSAFGSIWSIELLLVLKQRPDHFWTRAELIATLRASEEVLARSSADLRTAGLILVDEEQRVRFGPASPELEEAVEAVASLYARRPAAVRRLIVGGDDAIVNFADAFRFRRGD
ncbi:MAG TPA: hypothetical protein VE567_04955 [Sphingomonas sp.]|nr:hypothetical protein [Sphingomonas sp.]